MISIAKNLMTLSLLAAVFLSTALGTSTNSKEIFKGYLVDVSCSRDRSTELLKLGRTHTRKCLLMPDCQRSGFGIVTESGNFIPFDKGGNASTRALIVKLKDDTLLKIAVWGKLENGVIAVFRIRLIK